jgi:hypothetical protein
MSGDVSKGCGFVIGRMWDDSQDYCDYFAMFLTSHLSNQCLSTTRGS